MSIRSSCFDRVGVPLLIRDYGTVSLCLQSVANVLNVPFNNVIYFQYMTPIDLNEFTYKKPKFVSDYLSIYS